MAAITDPSSMAVDIWPTRVLLNRSQQRQVADYCASTGTGAPRAEGWRQRWTSPAPWRPFTPTPTATTWWWSAPPRLCNGALWSVRLPARRFLRMRATS